MVSRQARAVAGFPHAAAAALAAGGGGGGGRQGAQVAALRAAYRMLVVQPRFEYYNGDEGGRGEGCQERRHKARATRWHGQHQIGTR